MHLINAKLAGQDIPAVLPSSLVPPSLRGVSAPAPTEGPQQSTATKDLFDLFNDSSESAPPAASGGIPAASAFLPQPPSRRGTGAVASRQLPAGRPTQSPEPFSSSPGKTAMSNVRLLDTAPVPQPAGDLLGDDSVPSVPDKSADIGNKKLQLENTSRAVSELEKTKTDLERQESSNAADLQSLERDLASARSKHEAETKAVSDLRLRVGEQTAKLKQLRADVISAESDLNAMRMEKDELEQAFLRDKEEVRGLQKQIKELEDEKKGFVLLLEKLRKDARQQKGLVSIAKKQVSTAESGRDAVQAEVREVEQTIKNQEASGVTAPALSPQHTPRALSPNATGASQRSTNPFERFRTPSAEPSPNVAAVGITGALAGAAVGGAALAASAHTGPNEAADDTHVRDAGFVSAQHHEQEQDPFGLPTAGPAATSASGFDDSFGHQDTSAPTGVPPTDFDSAFADFDTEPPATAPSAEGAVPTINDESSSPAVEAIQRPEPARTLSTQAIPPSSLRSTPLPVEQSDAAQPQATHDDADGSAVEHPDQPQIEGAISRDAESSDDDEGPEDVDGPRRTYATEHTPVPQANEPRTDSVAADAEHPAARVRRHAPPPPTGRQSSRSDSLASPIADEGAASAFGAQNASTGVDPFGVTVGASPRSSLDPQSHSEIPRTDFGESFDPLSAKSGQAAFQTGSLPTNPAPTWPPTEDTHDAPKASQFDDEDEFDFSDAPAKPDGQHAVGPEPSGISNFGLPSQQDAQPAPVLSGLTQQHTQQLAQHDQSQGFSPPQPFAQQQPQQQQQQQLNTSAFDDEFANFDEDFGDFPSQPNSGSDNNSSMLRSYEVVTSDSVKQGQQEFGDGAMDAWGISNSNPTTAGQPAALSFDDAFGGDFSPVP